MTKITKWLNLLKKTYIYFLIFKIYTKKGGQELSYYNRYKVLTCRKTYDHIQIKIYYC